MSMARSTPAQNPRGPASRMVSGVWAGSGKGRRLAREADSRCLAQRLRQCEDATAERLALARHTIPCLRVTSRMTPPTATRDGPYVSIGLKIFTVAVVILALMCAGTALTVRMAASVDHELHVLGHSYAALARANIRSLERALYIRRLYINIRDGEGRATSEELRRRAHQAAANAERELGAAGPALRAERAGASSLRDPVALSRLDTLLEVIDERRADVAVRQTALMEALAPSADPPSLRSLLGALDSEREDYDRQVDEARLELYRIVAAAA